MAIRLAPRCLPNKEGQKEFGYSAKGFILPCCWCDKDDPGFDLLKSENLAVSKNDKIENIITSEAWVKFGNSLVQDYGKNAPKTCWKYCAKGKKDNKKVIRS